MKVDVLEIDTPKSVQDIFGLFKAMKCQIDKVDTENIREINGRKPEVAVLLSDRLGLLKNGVGWGVHAYIYDLGSKRHVDLIALGESAFKSALTAYAKNGGDAGLGSRYWSDAGNYFSLSASKKSRDKISKALS